MSHFKFTLICFLLGFINFSCVNENKTIVDNQSTKAEKPVNQSELAQQLYKYYYQNPKGQAQKEENILIDYAVDKNLDVRRTSSGLFYQIEQMGTGPKFLPNQPCRAHYKGYTLDGKIFDSSYNRGKPITFSIGAMIPGWNEALQMMNVGSKAKLLIPSRLAYGSGGYPGLIEPNTPLIFELEVLPLTDG